MTQQFRIWWPVLFCASAYLALVLMQHEGAFARRLSFGAGYLDHCATLGKGFRCSGEAGALKVISIPIQLKVNREYRIKLSGRSLDSDPAIVYVDFFGKNYDSPDQKGQALLLPGVVTTHVLRWPSGWPPASALLRISNREGTDFEVTSLEVGKSSKWIPRLATAFFYLFWAALATALWRNRREPRSWRLFASVGGASVRTELVPLLLLASAVALLLIVRVSTMDVPMVFGDEMSYALLSTSLGDPAVYWRNAVLKPLPNQLFFDFYHLATLCGEAALACARAMNCILFALAALPIFKLSRKVLARNEAFAVTAVILLLPNNAYTSFFMPEAFYFLGFYVVAWAFVSFLEPSGRSGHAAIAGFSLAALSLIKPHGLTILLVCNLALLVACCLWAGERARVLKGWFVMLVVFVVARGLLGISAAATTDGSLFRRTFGLYADLVSNTLQFVPDAGALQRLELAAIDNVGSLLLVFGPCVVIGVAWLTRSRIGTAHPMHVALDRLQLFTWITITVLLIGTIKFTAYIAGADPNQDPARIHERYYDFSFGLMLIAAYASLRALRWDTRRARASAFLAVLPTAAIAIWYLTHEFGELRPSWVDHPILLSVWAVQDYGVAFLALALVLATLLVSIRARIAGYVYAVALIGLTLSGLHAIWNEQAGSQTLWEADRAALALKVLFTRQELERGLIVGAELEPLYRTSFYLNANAAVRVLPVRSSLDVAGLARHAEWVLTYGKYQLPRDWKTALVLPNDATLYRRLPAE